MNQWKSNWSGKKTTLDIHSEGWLPKTQDDIHIRMTPGIQSIISIVKPLLERSLDKYKAGKYAELTSGYFGGSIIVATYRDSSGRINQFACKEEEVDSLGEELGNLLRENVGKAKASGTRPFAMMMERKVRQ